MTFQRILSITVLIFAACGDDSTLPIEDSGPSDAGQDIISFDTGPLPDAGPVMDAQTVDAPSDAGTDAPVDGGACLFTLEDGLSNECFPACVEGSLATTLGCADYECYLNVFQMGDGTGLPFDAGNAADNSLYRDYLIRIVEARESCHQCETLVTRACEFDVCPEESMAFFNCLRGDDGVGSCFPRSMAVYDCATEPANQATYLGCYDDGLQRCLR